MKATIDISLYPLQSTYKDEIIIFVQQLKKYAEIKIEVNGMSTQIYGDYDQLMALMQQEMKAVLHKTKAVFILKIAANERTKENLPEALK
jgi:uncharacterized protein YqgV (UPF0045/DUF77 family)